MEGSSESAESELADVNTVFMNAKVVVNLYNFARVRQTFHCLLGSHCMRLLENIAITPL